MKDKLLATARQLNQLGLNQGTAGNVSVREDNYFWITPSGIASEDLTTNDMVKMYFDGTHQGKLAPSSEWRFHRDILAAKPETGAIIHTHSMFATTLACLRQDIPPFHYMIALAGGDTIRCAPYALFGSQMLSNAAVQALQDRNACLLANHGMIAIGRDLTHALSITIEVETLCEQYWRTLQVGGATLLSKQEMAEVMKQFTGYGQWQTKPQSGTQE